MTIAWHVVGYCIKYGMAVYGRPYGLVPKKILGIEGYRISMTGFTQSKTVVGWGLNLKLKVSRFSGCLMLYG